MNQLELFKEETKQCRICKEWLTLDNFYLDRGTPYSKCKACAKEYSKGLKEAKKNAPEKPERCDCCGEKPENWKSKQGQWYCDHYPDSSKFRGWVCFDCNNAAGSVGDTYQGAAKLFNYLYARKTD
tara:strand:+ start:680 stop:1057 length:378 start_codon:yes stop_codon:yes gene_type:complete